MIEKIIVPPVIKDVRHKLPFPDDIETLPGLDPLFKTTTDFDWPELSRLMGEARELDEESIEKLAHALRGIIAWVITSTPGEVNLKKAALRIVALAWIIDPEFYGGVSLAEVSRRAGLTDASSLARQTGEASRVFGLRNRAQSHASGTWKKKLNCNVSR
jgi:hypothetical protein